MRKLRAHTRPSHQSSAHRRRFKLELLEKRLCLAAAPAFESLPGADHTVFLDFDGHVVEGTNWNSYYNQTTLTANPYDLDGSPNTFNPTELSRIEEAFNRVAEDFRPFNVNVTTIEPSLDRLQKSGSGDTQWGLRVIVSKESTMVNDSAEYCGCGGIAYINSFNNSGDLPVWVYTSGGKSVAEAASHEVGHALGLSHDGTSTASYYSGHGDGDTGWASIMGVGYYENVSQWDDGTYYDTNNGGSGANYNKGPDDLAVITTYNGFGYRADDHGNTNGAASLLTVSGTTVDDSGVIERSNDVDVYTFTTGAGNVTLNIDSFLPGPNLDIQADLYDSSGGLVASSNPAAGLNASLSPSLAAGQYYLHVDGVGVGNPTVSAPTGYSDYASLGSYTVSGSIVDPGQIAQLSVDDVSVNEADGTATFTVTLSGSSSQDVTVNYSTSDGSGTSPADYVATSGSLTFTPGGANQQTVTVTINEDSDAEGTETFTLDLSGATEATIADGQGVATIADNDADISIGDASANEGNLAKGKKNGGNTNYKDMVFTVTLSNPVDHDVIVQWSSADGTAVAGDDYEAASGTYTISAGDSSGTIVVRAIGDNDAEPDETFVVNLDSVTGATVLDGQGDGNILDDDSGGNGNGGNNGGGNGGGKPNRAADEALLVVDELWYFESVNGHEHGHEHGHGHEHEHHAEDHAEDLTAITAPLGLQQADHDDEREDDLARTLAPTDLVDNVIKSSDFSDVNAGERYVADIVDLQRKANSDEVEDETSTSGIDDSEIKQVLT